MLIVILIVILFMAAIGLLAIGHFADAGTEYSLRPWSLIPFALGFLLLMVSSFTIVKPGNVAVPVAFGKAGGAVGAGFHVKAPWTNYHSLTVKVQNYTMSSVTPEGAENRDDSVPVHALFRLTEGQARSVFVNLGGDYVQQIIRPIIRSAIRDQATPYNAIDLATGDREQYQDAVQTQVEKGLAKYGIELVSTNGLQIRDIHLPQSIQDSVNAKAKAQQDVQRQSFVLQSRRAEAQQRVVEAEGLAKSQTIIHSTLTPEYLLYLYISELGKLAQSKNTTFLFLPSNPDDLPNFQIPLIK